MPEREITRNHGDITAPYRSPSIMGAAIAIDREFFFEIGAFDTGLEVWGGDNSQLSLHVRVFAFAFSCLAFTELYPKLSLKMNLN